VKLERVNTGHALLAKMKLGVLGVVAGGRAPDVLRLLLYRPEYFGKPFMEYVNAVLRGPSGFTPGERELFAAYVSKLNRCEFCYGSHFAVAARALGQEAVEAALENPEGAKIEERLKAAMSFLAVLTEHPGEISGADVQRARQRGLFKSDIEELVHLCTIFCTMNALADALGFQVPAAESFARMAGPLLKHGYSL